MFFGSRNDDKGCGLAWVLIETHVWSNSIWTRVAEDRTQQYVAADPSAPTAFVPLHSQGSQGTHTQTQGSSLQTRSFLAFFACISPTHPQTRYAWASLCAVCTQQQPIWDYTNEKCWGLLVHCKKCRLFPAVGHNKCSGLKEITPHSSRQSKINSKRTGQAEQQTNSLL